MEETQTLCFNSLQDARQFIRDEELRTYTRYNLVARTKLAHVEDVDVNENTYIMFEEKRGSIKLPYDGVPFIPVATEERECHHGIVRKAAQVKSGRKTKCYASNASVDDDKEAVPANNADTGGGTTSQSPDEPPDVVYMVPEDSDPVGEALVLIEQLLGDFSLPVNIYSGLQVLSNLFRSADKQVKSLKARVKRQNTFGNQQASFVSGTEGNMFTLKQEGPFEKLQTVDTSCISVSVDTSCLSESVDTSCLSESVDTSCLSERVDTSCLSESVDTPHKAAEKGEKKTRKSSSKKLGCPAKIKMKMIIKLPTFKDHEQTSMHDAKKKKQIIQTIRHATMKPEDKEYRCYVQFVNSHQNHPIGQSADSNLLLDKVITKKIKELIQEHGLRKSKAIRKELEVFRQSMGIPEESRFCPSMIKIRNYIQSYAQTDHNEEGTKAKKPRIKKEPEPGSHWFNP